MSRFSHFHDVLYLWAVKYYQKENSYANNMQMATIIPENIMKTRKPTHPKRVKNYACPNLTSASRDLELWRPDP